MNFSRRTFLKASASSAALLAAGCDQMPRELRALYEPAADGGPFQASNATEIDPITHVLNRTAFGARPGDYARLSKLAATPEDAAIAYLEQQLHPEQIEDEAGDYAVRRFETLALPLGELFEYQEELLQDELMRGALARAVFSERQLYEVMVQFWSDHFNIDPSKGDCKWLKVADDREVIRKHALGRFSDMLRASALSPAMLWYLDGRVNHRANPMERPNENYARELLELHTLGVHGGYTQKDVMEVARCLTGWTVRSTNQKPYFDIGKVEFKLEKHDCAAKEVLGEVIPAIPENIGKEQRQLLGEIELDRVLRLVAGHSATAHYVGGKLCQRFIADEPPANAVAKVAAEFKRSDGDIPSTLRALFATEEFRSQRGNKFKRPFQYIASTLRATGAKTDSGLNIIDYLRRMGHAPFSYPTPDGYPEPAAPWLGTLLWRWNFALAISENKLPGTKVDATKLRERAGDDAGLMAHLLGRKPSDAEAQAYHESGAGLALMLASPAFQRC
jgi:uncharacterized protein (DUF1800 family)